MVCCVVTFLPKHSGVVGGVLDQVGLDVGCGVEEARDDHVSRSVKGDPGWTEIDFRSGIIAFFPKQRAVCAGVLQSASTIDSQIIVKMSRDCHVSALVHGQPFDMPILIARR